MNVFILCAWAKLFIHFLVKQWNGTMYYAYKSEQLEGSHTSRDWRIRTCFYLRLALDVALKNRRNVCRILKHYTNYCLERHAFYFLWLLLSFQPVYVFAHKDIVLCNLFN